MSNQIPRTVVQETIDGVTFEIEDIPRYLNSDNTARILFSSGGKVSAIWLDGSLTIQPYLSETQDTIIKWANGRNLCRVLILGNGCCSVARFFLLAFPGIHVDGVEKSAAITRLAKKYFCHDLSMESFSITEADAFRYVACKQLPRYDVIVVDLFAGSSFLPEQTSLPFLLNIERLLADDSIVCFNLSTAPEESRQMLTQNLSQFPSIRAKLSESNLFAVKSIIERV